MKTKGLRLLTPPLALILLYWSIGLSYLVVLPRAYQDEPWPASTALKLAREGVFATDLFEGFGRMEERYYGFLPAYPSVLAIVYLLADVGLFQSRWLGIVCGVLALALAYSLARRIWHDPRIGAMSMVLLLSVRWYAETKLHPTGILFLDATRLARYEVLVPVIALLSVHAWLSAQAGTRRVWYFIVGVLVGLCGLTHLYGLFLLPVFMLLLIWERRPRWLTDLTLMLFGVALVWLPYVMGVLADVPAWKMQMSFYSTRFGLADPQWYLENLRNERARYALGKGNLLTFILRPGVWLSCLAVGFSWLALALRVRSDHRARVLFLSLTLLPIAYALLLTSKFINYLILIVPFAALVTGWGIVSAWELLSRSRIRWLRAGIAFAVVLVLLEASTRIAAFQATAAATTPYAIFNARLRAFVPPGSRVLGLPDHWFGWNAYEYRSLAVPWMLINPDLNPAPPTLSEAMNAQRPDYILLDDAGRQYLAERADSVGREFDEWMRQHHAARVDEFSDPSYGWFEIYHVKNSQ